LLTGACLAVVLATCGAVAAAGAAPAAAPSVVTPRAFVKHPRAVPILVYHHVQSYEAG
jgi:hypothetical protein